MLATGLLLLAFLQVQPQPLTREYNRAWRLLGQGKPDDALPILDGILTQDPSYYRAYYRVNEAFRRKNEVAGALRFFDTLRTRSNVDEGYLSFGRGSYHLESPHPEAAIPWIRECLHWHPRWTACYVLANNAHRFGPAAVLAEVARVAASDPGNAFARLELANLGRLSGQARAETAFQDASRKAWDDPAFDPAALIDLQIQEPDDERRVSRAVRAGDEELEFIALQQLMINEQQRGQNEKAQVHFEQLLARIAEMENPRALADVYFSRAIYFREQGNAIVGAGLYRHALELYEKLGDAYNLSNGLRQLADCEVRTGDLQPALDHLGRARQIASEIKDSNLESFALRSMADIHSSLGNYGKAIELDTQAKLNFMKSGSVSTAGGVAGDLGVLFEKLGDYPKAEECYANAIRVARRFGDLGESARLQIRLAELSMIGGDAANAVARLRQALAICSRGGYLRYRARALMALGAALDCLGDRRAAGLAVAEALELSRSLKDVSMEMAGWNTLGEIRLKGPGTAGAERAFEEALDISASTGVLEGTGRAYQGFGDVARRRGALDDALSHYAAAIRSYESVRGKLDSKDFRATYFETAQSAYERMVGVLARQGKTEEALHYADKGRARTLLDAIGEAQGKVIVAPLTVADVKSLATRHHAILLEYSLGDPQSWVWAVSGDRTVLAQLPSRSEIETLVRQYRHALIAQRPGAVENGRTLYRLLVAPVAARLANAAAVVIVPDGILHYLPFETLIPQPGRFLCEDFTISYSPSFSVLAELDSRPAPAHRKELLAYGDPYFGAQQVRGGGAADVLRAIDEKHGLRLTPLPYSRRELEKITALYDPASVTVYVGAAATKESLARETPGSYKGLHFATHAFVDEARPERSGIALATTDGRDGILRVGEIVKLRLSADLVVLSACQTGLGKLMRGEGVAGLRGAFLYAGSSRVVASLWPVNDLAAAEFMGMFYGGMKAGQSPSRALRTAKLAMLHSQMLAYRDPKYWAPFVLVGEP